MAVHGWEETRKPPLSESLSELLGYRSAIDTELPVRQSEVHRLVSE